MNRCVFVGRLATDPEQKMTPSGVVNCYFRLAVQRRFKDSTGERQTDFISCVAWRQTAEYACRYLHKGEMIAVEGSLQVRQYEKDGEKRSVSEIIVDNIQSCGTRSEGGFDQTVQQVRETFGAGFTEVEEDDELPF